MGGFIALCLMFFRTVESFNKTHTSFFWRCICALEQLQEGLDKDLKVLLTEESKPKISDTFTTDCCDSTKIVYDKRFDNYYSCPKCMGKIKDITEDIEYGVQM